MGALTNILHRDGVQNVPGTKLTIKVNWSDNITTWPSLPSSPADDNQEVKVSDDFVCSTPFSEWGFIPNTGAISSDKVGSHYECSYEGEIFVPSASAGVEAKANLKKVLNSQLAVAIPLQNGDTIIAGESADLPAMIDVVNVTTGKVGEDATVKASVTIKWYSQIPGGAIITGSVPTS